MFGIWKTSRAYRASKQVIIAMDYSQAACRPLTSAMVHTASLLEPPPPLPPITRTDSPAVNGGAGGGEREGGHEGAKIQLGGRGVSAQGGSEALEQGLCRSDCRHVGMGGTFRKLPSCSTDTQYRNTICLSIYGCFCA